MERILPDDYLIVSSAVYQLSDGFKLIASNTSDTLGGTATDDGFWNVSDPITNGFTITYAGHYVVDGHLFLVFDDPSIFGGGRSIFSPTATMASSGYPNNYLADPHPTLVTTPLATCFAAGTMIATPTGERLVETLSIEDPIVTRSGKIVPVKWIGRQTLHRHVFGPRQQPVRIRANAFGSGKPYSDLIVTADHGIVLGDFVINASALVNDMSVEFLPREETEDSFTVYHVETERHEVILANGVTSETFVDAVTRSHFDNYQEYLDLYEVERVIPEMSHPRINSSRLVPRCIKAQLRSVDVNLSQKARPKEANRH